ncbi:hypothetical protein CV412_06865 [Campylobacter jejuni subsp. jejuni]|nr:hypothetical protein CV412_06865 [Campylobacter jejuni subsp. jejuni]
MLFFIKKPRNFHYLVNIYFTIKKFKKGLKHVWEGEPLEYNFTIKKFKKGLKQCYSLYYTSINFTIKKFKKGLK